MTSLFRRTFLAFLASFAVLLAVLGGALAFGYQHSLQTWSERRGSMLEQSARELLREHQHQEQRDDQPDRAAAAEKSPATAASDLLPNDIPAAIYTRDGNLLSRTRGGARRRAPSTEMERQPIRDNGTVIGYIEMAPAAFRNDDANRALTESLLRTAFSGALAAFAAALAAAWGFSRALSAPAARVAGGIDQIAHGRPIPPIPEEGTEEIARIARSANLLATRLTSEQELRAQWAQDVTHDLRTPIASIRSQLEAVADGVYIADPARISSTLSELMRVERLIDDLDELMRLEDPQHELHITPIDSGEFLQSLQQRFELEAGKKNLHWHIQASVSRFAADEALLYRAVSNLLSNAVRHADPGGSIGLESGSTYIRVCNTGTPIPADEIPQVFERLYRGEYARRTQGSGLGLTIAKRIVELHGGSIHLNSDSASGTTVTIQLH